MEKKVERASQIEDNIIDIPVHVDSHSHLHSCFSYGTLR